jgi:sugar (pentulose or hexulose) kinase
LTHLLKDEETLSEADWQRTKWIAQHGSLAAGYLTGRFDGVSISAAASTGLLDLRTTQWNKNMLNALADPQHREQSWRALPTLLDMNEPIAPLAEGLASHVQLSPPHRPLIFPTLDDQAAGLIGGGAVEDGHLAVILGNSAVVNSSSHQLPKSGTLDAMRTNWGPYLWMRCYSNGAQFLDRVVGANPDWSSLESAARQIPPGANDTTVLPFVLSEPSLGLAKPCYVWKPHQPENVGVRFRASLEAIAYLVGLAVHEHEAAGQVIRRITVSGGIARSQLMCEILASVLNRPVHRLVSDEGPALGAAVVALAGLETFLRRQGGITEPFTAADAVAALVKFREPIMPQEPWVTVYAQKIDHFAKTVRQSVA